MNNTSLKDPVLLSSIVLVVGFIGAVILLTPNQSQATEERPSLYFISTLEGITNVTSYTISSMPVTVIKHTGNLTSLAFANGYEIYPYGNLVNDPYSQIQSGDKLSIIIARGLPNCKQSISLQNGSLISTN